MAAFDERRRLEESREDSALGDISKMQVVVLLGLLLYHIHLTILSLTLGTRDLATD
jgi:hypothetical protein